MEQAVNLEELLGRDDFDHASYKGLQELLQRSGRHRDQLAALLDQMEQRAKRSSADQPGLALKLGLGWAWLGQYRAAAEWLQHAKRSREKHYYCGQALRHLGEYDGAVQEFAAAASAGWDALDCALERVETLLVAGRVEPARDEVDRIGQQWPDHPRGHVARGCLLQKQGLIEPAIEEFQAAVKLAPDLVEARFRLAYALDLHGSDVEAVEQYQQCVARRPAHVNALMNLAVICEDMGQLDEAELCLKQVLAADPNHARARLFLRDIQSARTMFIDEDQERMREKRDAILEMPINEFELSVRSRNCLKKMNINTIGDLLRISEAELLAYKNFGETSLAEIKTMLAQKGLRLGQLLQEQQSAARRKALQTVTAQGSPEILDKPVAELELSVRARKCLQRLNVQSLGDLASRTEAELMGTKNFGQTSLNEVKQRLAEYGLSLRKMNE